MNNEQKETHVKRLGIDLGTSSLGWAILDDDLLASAPHGSAARSPIEAGVIIFPEGMEKDKNDNRLSSAATRRAKRAMRRLIARRKYRKFKVLSLLIAQGRCPLTPTALEKWEKQGIYPVADKAFMAWLSSTPDKNPYADRARAATEKVDPFTLGRALYHIAQRRGFKSSRKEQLQELEERDNAAKNAAAGKKPAKTSDLGKVKKEIEALTAILEANGMTLGQYFHSIFGLPGAAGKIRTRKVGRKEHYEVEFDRIAAVQALSEKDAHELRSALFFQRPLRSKRGAVGACALEKTPRYPRCLEAHPRYELFRALAFLNNLRVSDEPGEGRLAKGEGRPLTPEERAAILDKMSSRLKAWTIADLQSGKLLKALKGFRANYRENDDFPEMEMTTRLRSCGIPEEKWQMALDALIDFDDLERLQAWAQRPDRLALSEADAVKFIRIDPSEERAAYSLHAIDLILPWLEKGRLLHDALFFAKFPSAIPNFPARRDAVLAALDAAHAAFQADKERVEDLYEKTGRLFTVKPLRERWRELLRNDFSADLSKLYDDDTVADTANPVLPFVDLGAIRNPLANRALTILRKLVNTLRAEGRIDASTIINIELAKSVNSGAMASAIAAQNKEKAKKNAEDEARLAESLRHPVTPELLLRYQLWEEQEHRSVYTGNPIGLSDITKCDIEHTVPRSLGGTTRRENLTLCEAHFNRDIKKSKLPCECVDLDALFDPDSPSILAKWQAKLDVLSRECDVLRNKATQARRSGDAAAYAAKRKDFLVCKLERDYWAAKLRAFRTTREEASQAGFVPRQLAGTGLITRQAVALLKTRYEHVYARNGATTAYARKAWGLQATDEAKDRADHVHHAIDACVIAALDSTRFTAICSEMGRDDAEADYAAVCPPPYLHFGEMIRHAADAILVRHLRSNAQRHPFRAADRKTVRLATPVDRDGRKISRVSSTGSSVRGSLHNDTLYGKILLNGRPQVVIRKAFSGFLNDADFEKAADKAIDPAIRKTLLAQIAAYKAQGVTNLRAQTYWMNKDKHIEIKKIRIKAHAADPDTLREQIFRKPGPAGDLHAHVYVSNGDLLRLDIHGAEKSSIVSLLSESKNPACSSDATLTLYPRQLALIYEHSPDELKRLTQEELGNRLYVIRTFDERPRLTLYHHREAREPTTLDKALAKIGHKSGNSDLDFTSPPFPKLRVAAKTFLPHMVFEGVSFRLTLSGKLEWLDD